MKRARVLERCKDDRILIKPGRNRWLIVRTDRDGATPEEMLSTLGAFLVRTLGRASPKGQNALDVFQDPDPPVGTLAAWFIGAARPVLAVSMSQQDPRPQSFGARLGRYTDCKAPRAVSGSRPWFFIVDFDWRGPETWTSWPASHVSDWGFRSQDTRRMDLDWLTLEAYLVNEKPLANDSTLGTEIMKYSGQQAGEAWRAAKKIASSGRDTLVLAALLGGGLLLAYGYSKKGNR